MTSSSRHSLAQGDVVLCNLPPYSTQPWLSMGVVLHSALLADAGVRARVVRPIDPAAGVPEEVLHASLVTLTFDPPMSSRLERMDEACRANRSFFESLLDELLVGGESVVGLSMFRSNVDLTLQVAKLLKERRPATRVVLAGPEAVGDPASLLLPFVDAVVGVEAERVSVPLMRALLEGRLDRAAELRNVWLHGAAPRAPGDRARLPVPGLPVIDYAPLMRLFVGDPEPTVPMMLNWGCPYRCAYCANRTVYSRFAQGSVERVLTEMDGVVAAWRALHSGAAPRLSVQLSDPTTNALPKQLDELLEGVVERIPGWGMRPSLRGQTLFDDRVTEERLQLWDAAGFDSTFFGLDVVDDDRRRKLHRPGNLAQTKEAVRRYLSGGRKGLGIGIPVGVPGETEAHFEATCELVEWVLSLGGDVQSFTVLPYAFFASAQNAEFVRLNEGGPWATLWRADVPGGDPEERARRFMRLFELIGDRAPTVCPIPPYLMLPAMLPDEDPARLDAWMQRHGRIFDQISPGDGPAPPERVNPEGRWARALHRLQDATAPWDFETFEHDLRRLTVVFYNAARTSRMAVQLEARDPSRPSFAHTEEFNVSYLNSWGGLACAFDEDWLLGRVRRLEAGQRG